MHAPHDTDTGPDLHVRDHLVWVATWARPTTLLSRRRALARFARAITPTAPLDATREQVEEWFASLTTTPIARQCEVGHVAGFYRWALLMERRADDPTARIKRPRSREYVPRPMDPEQVRRAVEGAPRRVRPMLLLMAGCGLRACEVAALTAGDVHRDPGGGGRLFVNGKGGKQRWVPAPQLVLDALAGLPRRGPLFLRGDGKPGPVSAQRVSALTNTYLHSVGIDATAHALRHTYATSLHRQTQDLLVVRDVLGHGSVETTQLYVAVSASRTLEAATRAAVGLLVG